MRESILRFKKGIGMVFQEYLISLPQDKDRRQTFYQQEYAENFIHIPAIAGKNHPEQVESFDEVKAFSRYGRELSLGEKACTLSHIKAWRAFIEDSDAQYAIICEDDALLSKDYPLIYDVLENEKNDFSILVIGESKTNTYKGNLKYRFAYPIQNNTQQIIYNNKKYVIGKLWKDFTCGTVGYVISRSAVEAMLRYIDRESVYWLADDYSIFGEIIRQNSSHTTMYIKHLYPRLVIENIIYESNLETERKQLQTSNKGRSRGNRNIMLMHKIMLTITSFFLFREKKQIAAQEAMLFDDMRLTHMYKPDSVEYSIIIPVYNGETTIKKAIMSCLNQSYSNVEVILVDDGSTDNTLAVVNQIMDSRLRIISLNTKGGTFYARKAGIKAATSRYVLFLDADDELVPDCCMMLSHLSDGDLLIYQYKIVETEQVLPLMCRDVYYTKDFYGDVLNGRLPFDWSSAGKVYRREVLLKTLEDLDYIEDKLINAEYLLLFVASTLHINQVMMIRQYLYKYYRGDEVRKYQKADTYIKVLQCLNTFISRYVDKQDISHQITFFKQVKRILLFEKWFATQKHCPRKSSINYAFNYVRIYGISYTYRKIKHKVDFLIRNKWIS